VLIDVVIAVYISCKSEIIMKAWERVHIVVDSIIEQVYECKWRTFILDPQFDSHFALRVAPPWHLLALWNIMRVSDVRLHWIDCILKGVSLTHTTRTTTAVCLTSTQVSYQQAKHPHIQATLQCQQSAYSTLALDQPSQLPLSSGLAQA
jgi:hypothetical protein